MKNQPPFNQKRRFYYGWIIVAVVALAGFSQTAETFPLWGVLYKPMTAEFGWSRSAFAGALSLATILGAVIAVVIGPVIDRFGPRWLTVLGFGIIGGSLVLMPLISELWHFYFLLVFGRMVHMGIVGISMSVITSKWFVAKRGRAVAISGVGNRVGSAVTPLYAQFLVGSVGWRWAVLVVGLVVWIVSLIPSALFLRRQPEDLGLHPDGIDDAEAERRVKQSVTSDPKGKSVRDISFTLSEVLRMPVFYFLTLSLSLGFMVAVTTSLHIVPHFTDIGLSPEAAVAVMSVSAIVGAAGSIAFGFFAEKVTSRVAVTVNFSLSGIAFLWLLTVDTFIAAMAWGLLYGTVLGGTFILHQIVMADYFGRASLGAIRGLVLPFQSIMQAAGPVAAGLAYDLTNTYTQVFGIFIVLSAISAILMYVSKPPQRGYSF